MENKNKETLCCEKIFTYNIRYNMRKSRICKFSSLQSVKNVYN